MLPVQIAKHDAQLQPALDDVFAQQPPAHEGFVQEHVQPHEFEAQLQPLCAPVDEYPASHTREHEFPEHDHEPCAGGVMLLHAHWG